jgi:putative phage-type endonuclease
MPLTDEQKQARESGLGSSEIAAIAGLSPYESPIDVWQRRMQGHVEEPETQPMKRGRMLEPAIAAWYAEDTGYEVQTCGTFRSRTHPVVIATPDRIAVHQGDMRAVELKTADWYMADAWGPAGTDEVPQHYLAQVAWEMAATGLPVADLGALIGMDFRIYHFTRDLEFEGMLVELAERFWRDNVIGKKPPAPDGSEAFSEWTKERFPRQTKPLLQANAQVESWVRAYRAATEAVEEAEAARRSARQYLELFLGEAEGVEGSFGKLTWKANKDSESVDWEAVARELKAPAEVVAKHKKVKPGPRVFRGSWKKVA